MVNNINNNTISETLAKQHLNALNEIKKKEIKNKRLINGQKELLNLFDDLLAILNNSNNKNNNSNNNSNNNNNNNNSNNNSNRIIVVIEGFIPTLSIIIVIEAFIPTLAVANACLP